ncbi:expressed unknown protein [Seminavis robusta]|uniref:Uncharacterized protein n=1 Tax=Seminavis robusta TaxID=568900 RepID=A0A9N8HKG7_9STRA|nr:expressed unknown protein [Seminavis robusta]|eukprot:Sro730_g194120.1 n/a (192) ;mRNA; r:43363-43938
MTSTSNSHLRPQEELQATLLPANSVLGSTPLPTATPVVYDDELLSQSWHTEEDAPVLPHYPTDRKYGDDVKRRLELAQRQGRQASCAERLSVSQHNRKVPAYNNQMDLDVNRANEVARVENHRERRLTSPALVTRSVEPKPAAVRRNTEAPQQSTYFEQKGTGYQVQDYQMDEYDGGDYSYDISEYKSDYE